MSGKGTPEQGGASGKPPGDREDGAVPRPLKTSPDDRESLRRARSSLEVLRGGFDTLWQNIEELKSSLAWRTLGKLLRAWMNPRTLGRGETILDQLSDELEDLDRQVRVLEGALDPVEVLVSYSDHALEHRFPVSLLVTNWNGERQLARLLESYAAHHAADEAEFIIVDHASDDGSVALVEKWMLRLPITLLRCSHNQRYAAANNLARRHARGDVLVFVNNDIAMDEPVLPALHTVLEDATVGMVGVPLFYPEADGSRSERLQHDGIRFAWDDLVGFMRPYNVKQRLSDRGSSTEVAAVTTALAACRAAAFDAVGGFCEDYDYGFEDVDLCLAMRFDAGLRTICCRGTGAIHQEFGTQDRQNESALAERRLGNARVLDARQGKRLGREILTSQFDEGFWHLDVMRLRLPGQLLPNEVPHELLHKGPFRLEAVGEDDAHARERFLGVWYTPDPQDCAACPPPPGAISVARIEAAAIDDWLTEYDFRQFDLLLCDSEETAERLRLLSRAGLVVHPGFSKALSTETLNALGAIIQKHAARSSISLKVATPTEKERISWGDFHFAEALGRAFRDRGYRVRVDLRPDWYDASMLPVDANLVLRGLARYRPERGMVNLAWMISHPDKVSDTELEAFDHVFVASQPYVNRLAERLKTPVSLLMQCTDPLRFRFVEEPTHPDRVVFVGNSKGFRRPIVGALLDAGQDVDVWGTWWDEYIDERHIKGSKVENRNLGALYGNSGIVLNDHWVEMRRLGFLSNRLFDAVACGAFVLSDEAEGLTAVFGDAVAVYREGETNIEALRQRARDTRLERRALAGEIARAHSFARRAEELDLVIKALRPTRSETSGRD